MDIALKIVLEFDEAKKEYACSAIKHSTPCGAALGGSVLESYNRTYECDPTSIFGGIVAFNSTVDENTAKKLVKIFLEIVIAKDFTPEALEVLKMMPGTKVVVTPGMIELGEKEDEYNKTFGTEFSKEWNLMQKDGGQLFSYFQQDKDAKFLCLYASDFDGNQIIFNNQIISTTDDDEVLARKSAKIEAV